MFKSFRDPVFMAGISLALMMVCVVWRLEADDPALWVKALLAAGMGVAAMTFVLGLERMIIRIHNTPPTVLRQYFRD